MMLNGQSGRIATGFGWLPAGASQFEKRVPAADSSSAIQGTAIRVRTGASSAATAASTKNRRASALAAMSAMVCGVEEGASGATATPARRAPRNTAAYSSEVPAQMAMASVGRMPSRCRVAATRSIIASSVAKETRRSPSISAGWSGRCLRMEADQLAVAAEGAGEQFVESHAALGGAGSRRRYMP
jgi:hypothetical protein